LYSYTTWSGSAIWTNYFVHLTKKSPSMGQSGARAPPRPNGTCAWTLIYQSPVASGELIVSTIHISTFQPRIHIPLNRNIRDLCLISWTRTPCPHGSQSWRHHWKLWYDQASKYSHSWIGELKVNSVPASHILAFSPFDEIKNRN